MRVLVVEDDPKVSRMLTRGLAEEGFDPVCVADAETALGKLRDDRFDVCVLDVLLPAMDGFSALAQARAQGIVTPILLLTARDGVEDRVRGLQLGADDYLVKPFAFAELLARLQAIHRRAGPHREAILSAGGVTIDPAVHRVSIGDDAIDLSQKQFALLELLLRHRGQVVSRAMILEKVFGYSFSPNTNIVDVHISNLRGKLAHPACRLRIETVRGVGYRADGSDAAR